MQSLRHSLRNLKNSVAGGLAGLTLSVAGHSADLKLHPPVSTLKGPRRARWPD